MAEQKRRIIISADHGLAVIYFLQSDVLDTLLAGGVEVVLLTDDALIERIRERFGRSGLIVEGLRLDQAKRYFNTHQTSAQWWLDYLRRAAPSARLNLAAVDSNILLVKDAAQGRRKALLPFIDILVWMLRRSRFLRGIVQRLQSRYAPDLYGDLFDKYQPELVVASTPGWRWDRYLLRQAGARGIPTASVIVGWDNPSSYGPPGADVDWITCWSEIHKTELIEGADWLPECINIAGIPAYDGYFTQRWQLTKAAYFKRHKLDPQRSLISYASSFITFSPNLQNIEALAQLVSNDELAKPAQLLIRLHPNHFADVDRFTGEREAIRALAAQYPHVHVVEPKPLGGSLGYYSGEDMDEKASLMAHSDVFVTVYSTMVVEASIHNAPVVAACIDSPEGWPHNLTLSLSRIGDWPTHDRFRQSGAGRVALTPKELKSALNYYLEHPDAQLAERQAFIARECAYTDAGAGRRTGEYLLSRMGQHA